MVHRTVISHGLIRVVPGAEITDPFRAWRMVAENGNASRSPGSSTPKRQFRRPFLCLSIGDHQIHGYQSTDFWAHAIILPVRKGSVNSFHCSRILKFDHTISIVHTLGTSSRFHKSTSSDHVFAANSIAAYHSPLLISATDLLFRFSMSDSMNR